MSKLNRNKKKKKRRKIAYEEVAWPGNDFPRGECNDKGKRKERYPARVLASPKINRSARCRGTHGRR